MSDLDKKQYDNAIFQCDNPISQCAIGIGIFVGSAILLGSLYSSAVYMTFGFIISQHPDYNRKNGCPPNINSCYTQDKLLCYQDDMFVCWLLGVFTMILLIIIIVFATLLTIGIIGICASCYDKKYLLSITATGKQLENDNIQIDDNVSSENDLISLDD